MRITSIGEDAAEHWHWLRPYMVRALDKGSHGWPVAHQLESVLAGNGFFLVASEAEDVLGVCKVDITPKGLHVHALAGKDLKKWIKPMDKKIQDIARRLGKTSITSQSRPAIAKMLKADGCKVQFYNMVRTVQ